MLFHKFDIFIVIKKIFSIQFHFRANACQIQTFFPVKHVCFVKEKRLIYSCVLFVKYAIIK